MKKCPKCRSPKKVHRSRRDSPLWLQLVGWHRFRCTNCNLYFEGFCLFPSHKDTNLSNKEQEEPQIKPLSKPTVKSEVIASEIAVTVGHSNGNRNGTSVAGRCLHCQS